MLVVHICLVTVWLLVCPPAQRNLQENSAQTDVNEWSGTVYIQRPLTSEMSLNAWAESLNFSVLNFYGARTNFNFHGLCNSLCTFAAQPPPSLLVGLAPPFLTRMGKTWGFFYQKMDLKVKSLKDVFTVQLSGTFLYLADKFPIFQLKEYCKIWWYGI